MSLESKPFEGLVFVASGSARTTARVRQSCRGWTRQLRWIGLEFFYRAEGVFEARVGWVPT